LLAPRPNPKLEEYPLLAIRDCLFNIFAATLHIGDRSLTRNLRTFHAVVTGTHLPRNSYPVKNKIPKNVDYFEKHSDNTNTVCGQVAEFCVESSVCVYIYIYMCVCVCVCVCTLQSWFMLRLRSCYSSVFKDSLK
jgi:hypothetical protein